MDFRSPVEQWHSLGDRSVERESWSLTPPSWRGTADDVWAVAPLGSLVAVVSDRLDPASSFAENVKCQLRIFRGGSFGLVTSVPWLVRLDTLLSLHWSDDGLLVAIFKNACVRVFSAHGEFMQHFYLQVIESDLRGVNLDPDMVIIHVWGAGAVYVNKDTGCIYLQRGFEGRNCIQVPIGDFSLRIIALGVLPSADWFDSILILCKVDGVSYIKIHDIVRCHSFDDFDLYIHDLGTPLDTVYDEVVAYGHASFGGEGTHFVLRERASGSICSMLYTGTSMTALWHGTFDKVSRVYVLGHGAVALLVDDGITLALGNDIDTSPIATLHFPMSVCCVASDYGGGIRAFSTDRCDYIGIVSSDLESVFGIGSCSPSAVLLRSFDMFHRDDVKACETLGLIGNSVHDAAAVCTSAALDCWDLDIAYMLLDAASFGLSLNSVRPDAMGSIEPGSTLDTKLYPPGIPNVLTPMTNPDTTDSMGAHGPPEYASSNSRVCSRSLSLSMLRVASALRSEVSDIRTTGSQLLALDPRFLSVLLSAQHCHLLAMRISDFLGIDKNPILLHWVRTRVKLGARMTDSELLESITKLLDGYAGMLLPYADIACAVAAEKRFNLALLLLDRERSLPRKFRTLCSWGEYSKAGSVAIESCDLMYAAAVLFPLQSGHKLDGVVELARGNTCVRDVFVKQCRLAGAGDVLQVFFERLDDIYSAGVNAVRQALSLLYPVSSGVKPALHQLVSHMSIDTKGEDCSTWLKFASDFFTSLAVSKGAHVENARVWRDCISHQRSLISMQLELERSIPGLSGLVGRSLSHTVYTLYRLERNKDASSLANKFNMPFTQHWRCRLSAAHAMHNINDLLQMANDKSAHNQYVCMKNGKAALDLVLEALLSLGATSAVESVVVTLRQPQQQYWRDRLNVRSGVSVVPSSDTSSSLISSISRRLWHG
ncbi:Vps16 N-terminal region family protein [Babesia bovis T2Bo]|uniref:Vps16 N-terminal domain-containing protein n=1 Tax=Babesia bovis TaxID=5865 RepID=A7ASM1_BABBO|nr:Vps16 N-terminal region family protein [Babesia bovis T2Bo]EDO07540.1 Vps16 N-terminal region family protein [Babesia bovis T2Bo]|eukprot:XP_001611108.1 hypothetical protein [Babesia bovis T2Bo]